MRRKCLVFIIYVLDTHTSVYVAGMNVGVKTQMWKKCKSGFLLCFGAVLPISTV